MKSTIALSILFFVTLAKSAFGAPFQNLGFEDGDTSSLAPYDFTAYPGAGIGSTASLLPGWQVSLGNNPVTSMGLNLENPFDTSSRATLIDSAVVPPIEGRYTLRLIRGTLEHFSISQRGDLPADARYLTFISRNGPFWASVNGIDLTPLGNRYFVTGNFTADISSFAGQTVDLTFRTIFAVTPTAGPHDIDAISISVPEPPTIALALVGISALASTALLRRGYG